MVNGIDGISSDDEVEVSDRLGGGLESGGNNDESMVTSDCSYGTELSKGNVQSINITTYL